MAFLKTKEEKLDDAFKDGNLLDTTDIKLPDPPFLLKPDGYRLNTIARSVKFNPIN